MKTMMMCFVLLTTLISENSLLFAQTQTNMNEEACQDLRGSDRKLNQLYQQILAKYKGQEIFISRFKDAQRKWLVFRDAHLEAVYPTQNEGTVNPMCQCIALREVTEDRIKEMKVWLNEGQEGDMCYPY